MIRGIGDIVSSTYSQTLNGRERGVAQLNPDDIDKPIMLKEKIITYANIPRS